MDFPRPAYRFLCLKGSRTIPVDVGVYTEEFGMPENLLFLNAYNLKDEVEAQETAKAVAEYVNSWGQAPQHSE